MSTISTFYDTSFTVKRTTTTDDKGTDTAAQVATGTGALRPITDREQLFDASRWGKEYKLWCDESVDIKVGDTVAINSDIYGVAGVSDYTDYAGDDRHLEVVIYLK